MRKIAVFTGTRAEYGLLYWICKGLQQSPQATLQLYVGGTHLSTEFGNTVDQILQDGFDITERLEFLISSDTPSAIGKSMALALIAASDAFDRHQPDLLVLLGDRFECLAVAQAAMLNQIPIAHIHGGEITEGAIDDAVRHSITKMSHLHFTSTQEYARRVIQLGEDPSRVFNTGAPGLDSISRLNLLSREDLDSQLGGRASAPFFVVTYHPETLSKTKATDSLGNLLEVLDSYSDHNLVISYPNADTHGRALIAVLENYRRENPDRVMLVRSLGQLKYLSALKHCDAVIGNSSSGLIEAPAFGVPTLNIGIRQKGRIAGDTVIHCGDSVDDIRHAMIKATSADFREYCSDQSSPYGNGDASDKIVAMLLEHPLDNIVSKSFFNIPHNSA